jgi:hypothetical protein
MGNIFKLIVFPENIMTDVLDLIKYDRVGMCIRKDSVLNKLKKYKWEVQQ